MKATICLLIVIIFMSGSVLNAMEDDITIGFKLWLLTNEARALSSLSSDNFIISRMATPFSISPENFSFSTKAFENLWSIHRKIYVLLDEVQHIYNVAKKYGDGRLAIIYKQARPEIWILLPFGQIQAPLYSNLYSTYRKSFHETMLRALSLNIKKDIDLSARLRNAFNQLSSTESRLFQNYLDTFSALYPSDSSAKIIKAFIQTGIRKQFANGISQLLKPEFVNNTSEDARDSGKVDTQNDLLAELEKLSSDTTPAADTDESLNGEKKQNSLEEDNQEVSDMFNIWD